VQFTEGLKWRARNAVPGLYSSVQFPSSSASPSSCGCIEVGSEETPHSANSQPTPAWTPVQSVPYVMPGASEPLQHAPVTPAPGPTLAGTVVYTEPIPPSIAMNFSYRNLPYLPDSLPLPFDYPTAPFFSATYDLKWDNIALLAQPSAPPFVIEMEFVAGHNHRRREGNRHCPEQPDRRDRCRGWLQRRIQVRREKE